MPNPTGWVDPLGLSCKAGNCPGDVLDKHEKAGGHLLKKHVRQTDEQLAARLELEPNIPAASTFRSKEEAEVLVSKSLITRHQEILKFLEEKKDAHMIVESSSQPVGVSLIRGNAAPIPVNNFILILKRKPKMPDGYLLLTGFPKK